jgi:drug/metabolite transporter (DMT)-like permease
MLKLTHTRAVWLMVVVTLLWSIAGVVTRHLEHARSFEVTFWRSFFTVLRCWSCCLPSRAGACLGHCARWRALWLSGLCWSVMFTAFMVAMTLMPVANVLVTMAVGPLAHGTFCADLHRPPHCAAHLGGHWAGRAGYGWMYGSQMAALPLAGTLVALCVPVAAAANWTVVQHSQRHGHAVDLVPAVLVGAVLSALATLPLALPLQATGHMIYPAAGFAGGVAAGHSLRSGGALRARAQGSRDGFAGLLEVIFGILLAWGGAGERPGPAVLMVGLLVIGALVFNEMLGWKEQK